VGTGGTIGMLLGYEITRYPLELCFLQMVVGALQTMTSCAITVGIGEALNVSRPAKYGATCLQLVATLYECFL
jgi:hypothetical protein